MAGIGELVVGVTARTQKANRNINTFRGSIGKIPKTVASAQKSMAGLITTAAGLAGVSLSVAAAVSKANDSFEEIDSLAKTSDKLGIATEKLSAYRFAAEQTGVQQRTLDVSLQRWVRRLSEAAHGTGEAQGAIAELGLDAQKLAQMSVDESFVEVAEAMSKVENQGDRVRLAFKLFDSEGVGLINTLKLGRAGLEEYEREAAKLGITVSRVDAAQIEKANDAWDSMGRLIDGISNQVAIQLAPIIETAARSIEDWGTAGESSGAMITKSIRGVAGAVGVVLDGIEFWKRMYGGLRAIVAEGSAFMAEQMEKLAEVIADVVGAIPGVEKPKFEFAGAFADEMAGAAERARKEADDAWKKPLPSAGINQWFKETELKIMEARVAYERNLANMTPPDVNIPTPELSDSTKQGAQSIGGVLAGFQKDLSSTLRGTAKLAVDPAPITEALRRIGENGIGQTITDSLGGIGESISESIGRIGEATGLSEMISALTEKTQKQIEEPITVELPPAVTRGSREEYRVVAEAANRKIEESQARSDAKRESEHDEAQEKREQLREVLDQVLIAIQGIQTAESV